MSLISDALSGPDDLWASFWMYMILGLSGWAFMFAVLPVLLVLSLTWILGLRVLDLVRLAAEKACERIRPLLSRCGCRRCYDGCRRPEPVVDITARRGRRRHRRHHQRRERPRVLSWERTASGRWSDLSSLTVHTGTRGAAARGPRPPQTEEGTEAVVGGGGGGGGVGAMQPLLFGCQRRLFYNYASVTPSTSVQTIYGGSEESSGDRAYLDAREGFSSSSSLSFEEREDVERVSDPFLLA